MGIADNNVKRREETKKEAEFCNETITYTKCTYQ